MKVTLDQIFNTIKSYSAFMAVSYFPITSDPEKNCEVALIATEEVETLEGQTAHLRAHC